MQHLKRLAVACLLASLGASAFAANYFYIQPKSFEMSKVAPYTVALNSSALPNGVSGQTYNSSGFDLKSLLVVTGDSAYDSSLATFELKAGSLPVGILLGSNGLLSGTPSAPNAGASFTVAASYKSKQGQQTYNLVVTKAPPPAGFVTSSAGITWSPRITTYMHKSEAAAYCANTPLAGEVGWSLPSIANHNDLSLTYRLAGPNINTWASGYLSYFQTFAGGYSFISQAQENDFTFHFYCVKAL